MMSCNETSQDTFSGAQLATIDSLIHINFSMLSTKKSRHNCWTTTESNRWSYNLLLFLNLLIKKLVWFCMSTSLRIAEIVSKDIYRHGVLCESKENWVWCNRSLGLNQEGIKLLSNLHKKCVLSQSILGASKVAFIVLTWKLPTVSPSPSTGDKRQSSHGYRSCGIMYYRNDSVLVTSFLRCIDKLARTFQYSTSSARVCYKIF